MKKHLFILLACCLTTMASAAYEFTDSLGVVWTYTVDESTTPATVTLTGVTNHTTDIVCPDTLYYIVEEDTTCYFITALRDELFKDKSTLTSVTLPETLTKISVRAFSGCSGLTSITIPASVTTIGSYAFWGCSGLTSLTIPASVTIIENYAFGVCNGLKELTIEDAAEILTLPSGTSSVFSSSPLEKVYLGRDVNYGFANTAAVFYDKTTLTSVTISDKVTTLGSYLFYNCSSLTSVTIPANVTTIGSFAFSGCSGIKELILEDGTEILTLEGPSSMFSSCPLEKVYLGRDLTYGSSSDYSPFYKQTDLTAVTIGKNVTTIGSNAFYGCSGLTSMTIPASVTSIGSSAFHSCSSLTSMTIPASVTTIGSSAFSGCSGIKELTFEDGTEALSLATQQFSSCPLEKVYLGRDLTYSTNNSNYAPFYYKTALTAVTIGENVTTIGSNAFCGCSGLTSLTIPASVTTIGSYAFYGCSKLSEVNVKSIESWLNINFENSYSNPVYYSKGFYIDGKLVTDIVVPSTVTEVKDYAFYCNKVLLSVDLGDAVTTIGSDAFSGCSGLTSITIPASVTTIGSSAFSGCSGLTSITIPASVTTIGSSAFSGCSGLTSITIPASVTTIGSYAFKNCSGLASLTLGDAVTTIGADAFYYCSNLKDLYIANLDAWAAIEYGNQYSHPNSYATNIYHNDKLVTEVEIPTTITTIPDYTFYNFGDVVKVKLHEGVESIGQSAFQNVPAVFEVAATAVPTLGTSAISAPSVVVVPQETGTAYSEADGWANLIITTNDVYEQTLTLEAAEDASSLHKTLGDAKLDSVVNLTISGTINSYDFMVMRTKMTKLRNLDLTNATVKYNAYQHYTGYHTADSIVPGYAFYNCNLFGLKLPKGTKSIETDAIYSNDYLREVILPEGMTTIGRYALGGSLRLREVDIPEGVMEIKDYAIRDCRKLQSITFPTTLEIIGLNVFEYTSALEMVDFSHTDLRIIGSRAFDGCSKLTEVKLPAKTLREIRTLAFSGCSSLKEIRIPSSVRTIGDKAFTGCTNLEKVYVYTVEPISIGQNTFALTGNNFVGALYAPRVSYYTYWYDTQWGQFQSVNEFDEPYEYAYFEGDTTLDPSTGTVDGDGETLPDADMGSQSGNTVNGAEATEEEEEEGGETPVAANGMRRTQAATATTLTQEWGTLNVAHNGTDGASIIAKNGGAVTAETANFRIKVTGGKWYFLSFPFDIKKENIKCEAGANYVFRYYDGAVRATKGNGGWTNVAVADDGTYLKAGKGYIFQASKTDVLVLTVEDMSIVSEDKNTTVEAYAADNTANASWNFVGNPYLSYYNVTAADYSAPITVWNGSSYQAVRPGDDEYQLAPFEAFFVQKPEGVNGITYATTSQTTYQKIQAAAAAAPGRRTAEINPDRLLVNIALTDGTTADQTRVVFNNAVSMDYEMECDAAKFSTAGVPQLYTIDSRAVKYAINERPVAEGVVTMGFTAPAQGVYTLSAPRMDTPMLLRDNATSTIHDFAEGSYEFASEAGTFDDRFTLMMKAGETTSIDNSQWTIDSEAPVYNTKGQRVNEATEQGIYIKGNRKVVTL